MINYEQMTNNQLKDKMAELEAQFKEYQSILKDAYEQMTELGNEYDKIKGVIDSRSNG